MSLLVVGSVALDSVRTPFGVRERSLGGAATHFSVAASFFTEVSVVAVIGEDFTAEDEAVFHERRVNTDGLQRISGGRTFHWAGEYGYDLNTAKTLATDLNVFADFKPQLTAAQRKTPFLFLANILPSLQREVREQADCRFVALDTMNYWIDYKRDVLTEAFRLADVIIINEAETKQFAKTFSLIRAARKILDLGPSVLIIKKGEYGAAMFANGENPISSNFFIPAYPLEKIQDPTGAGDSFAGGFMGYLARSGAITIGAMKRAIVHGSVVASFVVEDFSVNRLKTLETEEIAARYEEFKHFTHFEHFAYDMRPTGQVWERLAVRG